MKNRKTRVFYLSLILIGIYWLYDVYKAFLPTPPLPDDTNQLWTIILITKVTVFAIIYGLLRGQGDGFKSLGWRKQKYGWQILRGTLFGILLFVLTRIIIDPAINSMMPPRDTGPGIMAHFNDMSDLWIWLLVGIIGGGFIEELQRIFIITRFEKWKGVRIIPLIVLIDIVSFGIGHLYQGIGGAISAAISGLVFAFIYLRNRSFIEAFTCHAIYDVIGITLGHLMMVQQNQM